MNQIELIERPRPPAPANPPAGHYRDRYGIRELMQPILPKAVGAIMEALKRGPMGRRELHLMSCPYLNSHTLGKHLDMLSQQGFVIVTHNFNRQLWEEPVVYSLAGSDNR
ncbi:hypothetical protein ACJO2E_02660 [Marinobacter sp. M1N3S26]|uniref:hypothetical protein n=1 Tax=Marinobacter sp. M1N3S26 TaxID=3382299 RepID=UPI00387B5E0E